MLSLKAKPEKEHWHTISRDWYASGLANQPGSGKLHHHLRLLSRESAEGEELKGIYHFITGLPAYAFIHAKITSVSSQHGTIFGEVL